jgi:uncharacterized membrane protein
MLLNLVFYSDKKKERRVSETLRLHSNKNFLIKFFTVIQKIIHQTYILLSIKIVLRFTMCLKLRC